MKRIKLNKIICIIMLIITFLNSFANIVVATEAGETDDTSISSTIQEIWNNPVNTDKTDESGYPNDVNVFNTNAAKSWKDLDVSRYGEYKTEYIGEEADYTHSMGVNDDGVIDAKDTYIFNLCNELSYMFNLLYGVDVSSLEEADVSNYFEACKNLYYNPGYDIISSGEAAGYRRRS